MSNRTDHSRTPEEELEHGARALRERFPEANLKSHSADVRPGDVFVALPGRVGDGRRWIRDALARGAALVAAEAEGLEAQEDARVLAVPGLAAHAGSWASAFLGNPSSAMTGVAVTGTNGKTTSTFWAAHLFCASDTPCASIGTIGCRLEGRVLPTRLTTPDAVTTQSLLEAVRRTGARAFAIEASSAGLEQGRLEAVQLRAAAFTNLTRDHLDYHPSWEDYILAKERLMRFEGLEAGVLNADDPTSGRMAAVLRARGVPVWAATTREGDAGLKAEHVLRAARIVPGLDATRFRLEADGRSIETFLRQPGLYNVENALTATGLYLALGGDLERAAALLPELPDPPGRLEEVFRDGAPLVVVDYAHTPDGLEKVLRALRPRAEARGGALVLVFGCCGARDKGKRPMMGAVAAQLADRVIVTSDNPRTEDPLEIAEAVRSGMSAGRRAPVELDRNLAVRRAVAEARPEDVILLTGKGPESVQILANGPVPYNDVETARAALADYAL